MGSSSSLALTSGLYGASSAWALLDESVLAVALCPAGAVDWAMVLLAIDVGM